MDGGLPTNIKLTTDDWAKRISIEVMIAAASNVCTELNVEHGAELADEFKKHKIFKHENLKKICVIQILI